MPVFSSVTPVLLLIQGCLFHVAAILSIILSVIHCKKVVSHLHPKNKENCNKIYKDRHFEYKLSIVLSLIVIILNTLCASISSIINWQIFDIKNNCAYIFSVSFVLVIIGRGCLYLFFLFRLHLTYANTMYQYNKNTLIVLAVFIGSILLSFIVYSMYDIFSENRETIEEYNEYIIFCSFQFSLAWTIVVVGTGVAVVILYLIAFTIPLRKVINFLYSHGDINNEENEIKLQNLIETGIKLQILTIVIVMSRLSFGLYIYSVDLLINSVCVALLTPFYHKYYPKLCCLCIKCVHKIKDIEISNALKRSKTRNIDDTAVSQTIPYLSTKYVDTQHEMDNDQTTQQIESEMMETIVYNTVDKSDKNKSADL